MSKALNLELFSTDNGFGFRGGKFAPTFTANGDFWRMHLDSGEHHEIGVYSSAQTPVSVSCDASHAVFEYDKIVDELGTEHRISLTVFIDSVDGELRFSADITNNADVRLNELQLPLVEFDSLASKSEDEILYIPNGYGEKIINVRERIRACHTEYMAADYKNIWYFANSPHSLTGDANLSMSWLGVQSGKYFVYLAHQEEYYRMVTFGLGTLPRGQEPNLIMSVSRYPALYKGESVHCAGSVLAVFDGGWRNAADHYRAWSERTWLKSKTTPPEWVKEMDGWQRIILKHQYGEIFHRYDELPQMYLNGAKNGIHTLLIFGWWKGRFDNNYPEYEADEALGGAEGLKAAIDEVHRLGGRVLLYTNGNLIDVKTAFYRNLGHKICSKDIDENEYREHYRFSNNGSLLRNHGYKSFVTACHSTDEWRERLLEHGRMKLDFGCDAIFYDQLGCCNKMCFDRTHPHGNRIDTEAEYRIRNMRAICSILDSGHALGTEWHMDRIAANCHFIHGCGFATSLKPTSFPAMFKYTFPEFVCSNRELHDEREDYVNQLHYAFVHGMIFDVAHNRCRVGDITYYEGSQELTGKLAKLRAQYRDFFNGKYLPLDESLPHSIQGAIYENADGERIIAVCNTATESFTFTAEGTQLTLAPSTVQVVRL